MANFECRYLNMRTKAFCKSEQEMADQNIGYTGTTIMAIPYYNGNQTLIAMGATGFTKLEALHLCRRLSAKLKSHA